MGGLSYSYTTWEEDINEIINFLALRPCLFADHLVDFLDFNNLSLEWANTFLYNYDLFRYNGFSQP